MWHRIAETPEEAEARLAKWTKYLEAEEAKKSALEKNHNAGLEGGEDEEDEEENETKADDEVVGKTPNQSTNSEIGENSSNSTSDDSKVKKNVVPGDDSDTGSSGGDSDGKED